MKMKFKAIIIYYDLEEGRYYTQSEFNRLIKNMAEFEINSRFIPIVKSCGG